MRKFRLVVLAAATAGACVSAWGQTGARKPATTSLTDPQTIQREERARLEAETAAIPVLRVTSLADVVRFGRSADLLTVRTPRTDLSELTRISVPDAPALITLHVIPATTLGPDRETLGFTLVCREVSGPANRQVYTSVSTVVNRVIVSRDEESDTIYSSTQLIQDPPRDPQLVADKPVRLLVKKIEPKTGRTLLDLRLDADTFTQLCREHAPAVNEHLRPIFHDLGQESIVFAIDPRAAWQVVADAYAPDAQLTQKVEQIARGFDSPDYQQREAALHALEAIGQPGALVLMRLDRSGVSPEIQGGVDSFLADYLPLKSDEVLRLRDSPEFLLDSLYADDAELQKLVADRLRRICPEAAGVDFDVPEPQRSAAIAALRAKLSRRG
ncbi:MAG: hypothetical protein ACREJC_15430 [Tepidisphaeraceae bacterium]